MRLCQQALELAVIQLELAHPFVLAGVHADVFGAPLIKAGFTEAVFVPNLLDRHANFGLPKQANDLTLLLSDQLTLLSCPSFSKVTDFLEK